MPNITPSSKGGVSQDSSDLLVNKKRDIQLTVLRSKTSKGGGAQVSNRQIGYDNGFYSLFAQRGLDVQLVPSPPSQSVAVTDVEFDFDNCSGIKNTTSQKITSITVSWVAFPNATAYKVFYFFNSGGNVVGYQNVADIPVDPLLVKKSNTGDAFQENTDFISGLTTTIDVSSSTYNSEEYKIFAYIYAYNGTTRLTKFPKYGLKFIYRTTSPFPTNGQVLLYKTTYGFDSNNYSSKFLVDGMSDLLATEYIKNKALTIVS